MESTEIKNENVDNIQPVKQEDIPQGIPQRQAIPEELNQQQALQVLVDAARIAQSKGVFSLDDAELVNKAIRAFVPKTPAGPVASNS